MHGSKPVNTHMATGPLLTKLSGEPFEDPHLYRSVVGGLQYATITRPEISFVVNRVSVYAQPFYMSLGGSQKNSTLSQRYDKL
jgi:hypothetical protein